jgi:hypothetical protein
VTVMCGKTTESSSGISSSFTKSLLD